jgi:hypothetical protein
MLERFLLAVNRPEFDCCGAILLDSLGDPQPHITVSATTISTNRRVPSHNYKHRDQPLKSAFIKLSAVVHSGHPQDKMLESAESK